MYNRVFKRFLDLFIATMAFLILLPVNIPIVIILLLTGEHYIFYQQKRVGYKNIRFQIWKYATMLKISPTLGTGSLTVKNDPRVFPFGRFLRKTKINELPQLINIFQGNMSIVGPRPQMEVDFYKFPEYIQNVIYNSKPGITGIGSIVFRDEEELLTRAGGDPHEFYKIHLAPYKGELEVWYSKNVSFLTDLKIIFLTAWVIISPKSELTFKLFDDLPEKPGNL
ncbi:MAG: sugar transferase [Lentimicrobiaceae bacterium]